MRKLLLFLATTLFMGNALWAAPQDLGAATISVRGDAPPLEVASTVLQEEVARRTGVQWQIAEGASQSGASVTLALAADGAPGAEGFTIATGADGKVSITGADARGVLFGVGYFLRQLDWGKGKVSLPEPLNVSSKPEYAIRGHQLGYRARANSWDAWTVEQFDQFIRELALFGTNAIENIPFQDDQVSPHNKVSREEMNRELGRICDKYDLDYWVWVPADYDLKDPAKREEALRAHEAFYADCPRLNGVFFPGGDPGSNHPQEVMPFLQDISVLLQKHHPNAKVWLSPQGFNMEETDYMFTWLAEHKPEWFGGVVGGPGSPPLEGLRERLDKRYMLRDYPDITHIVRCQYPVPNLDQAFALTLGRECIMARPLAYKEIHARTAPHTDGFISYTDGVHDDPNKILWSQLAWDSSQDPRDIMVDYCRFFFGAPVAERAADGLLALERNWDGPIHNNGSIEGTLALWQQLEAEHPELEDNWRWQMYVTRGYYDAYTRARLFYERALEDEANAQLAQAEGKTPQQAMDAALAVLNRAVSEPTRPELRDRIIALYADLFKSISLQSDTEHYQASGPERGASLEFLDYPLNNRFWLEDEFKKVGEMSDAAAQWARLEELRTWENPGPGSFYDDLGHLARSPHVVWEEGMEPRSGGFAWWDEGHSRTRLSWQITMWPRNGLKYTDLDQDAKYTLRFTSSGDMKAFADEVELKAIRYGKVEAELKEYEVPQEVLKDGELLVTLEPQRLPGVNWRQQPRLAEAWLIKH